MKYAFNRPTIYILLLLSTFIFSACGNASSSEQSSQDTTQNISHKAIHKGQVTDSKTGYGLKGVEVVYGDIYVTTDQNGFYSFLNIKESDNATINFNKKGYLLGSKQINITGPSIDKSVSTNYLTYNLYSLDHQYKYTSEEAILTSHINIPASVSYTDIDGNNYNNDLAVELIILDNNKTLISNFIGAFNGMNIDGEFVQFESFGLISILIREQNGNNLTFSNGDTGTLTFKPTASINENILPLWYYNYRKGLWVEKGYAQLQNDGTYKGEITQPGTWSINKPLEDEPGIYSGRIIDNDGMPIDHARLKATGSNWISNDLSTDENGYFEISVIPNRSFRLEAYDYDNRFRATYADTIPAIPSGIIIEN